MNKEREMKTLVIAALVISVVAIGVGFAAFSTTLQINGTATVNTLGWDVRFTNIELDATKSTANVAQTTPTISNGTIGTSTTNTKISTITAKFTEPGQKLVYNITVSNNGDYNALLTAASIPTVKANVTATDITTKGNATDTIQAAKDASNVLDKLNFSFTKADGTALSVDTDTIAKKTNNVAGTQVYTYTIEYTDFDDATLLPTDEVEVTIPELRLTFTQTE